MMDLLWAMDIYPDVEMISPEPAVVGPDLDTALEQLRFRLAVREGTDEDERLRAAGDELLEETTDGDHGPGSRPDAPGRSYLETERVD